MVNTLVRYINSKYIDKVHHALPVLIQFIRVDMVYIRCRVYWPLLLYYFPSHFLLIITSFTDALYASLFVIVYSYVYTIQSPNTALLSCLLWTLGIVIHLYTQYI